jgi:hypothetical protein
MGTAVFRQNTPVRNRTLIWVAPLLAALLALSYLVMLNSGLGYDSLFYLIMGEDWAKGIIPFSAAMEVKPLGIFLIARLIVAHLGVSPYAINLAVLFINCLLIATTVICCAPWLDRTERALVALLLLGLGFLTEMSFLLTDQPTALFGILGFRLLMDRRAQGARSGLWNLATGAAWGVAFLFKAVAALYLAAAWLVLVVIAYRQPRQERRSWASLAATGLTLGVGFAIPFLPVAGWAYQNHILGKMALWSIWVPLFRYPANRLFLVPFLVKSGAFLVAWLAAIWYWRTQTAGKEAQPAGKGDSTVQDRDTWLTGLLIFGGLSLASLMKTQSSHYLIDALPFMAPFVIAVWVPALRNWTRGQVLWPALLAAVAAGAGGKLLARLHTPNFESDRRLAADILKWTKPGEHALFINGVPRSSVYAYWITGLRQPKSWSYLAIEPYSYGMSAYHQGSLVRSLEDSSTTLVGVALDQPPSYLNQPWPFSRKELEEANTILRQKFEPVNEVGGYHVEGFWKLKGRSPNGTARFTGGPFAGQSVNVR